MKFLIFIFIVGCSTSSNIKQELNSDTFYKRDMIMEMDGKQAQGAMVVPQKDLHKLHITARGELDLLTFTTCHREETAEKAWNVTEKKRVLFFKKKIEKKREVKMDYKPTEMEMGYCPIFIGGYELKGGRHSWGFIDFETEDAKLTAKVQCNGTEVDSKGVSVCQAKSGLYQSISFLESVTVSPDIECSIGQTTGKYFEFPINKGKCVYAFMSKNGKIHRLTTLGYEKILIRE